MEEVAPGHNEVGSSPALWNIWSTPAEDIPLAKSHRELWPDASLPYQVPAPWKGKGREATASQCGITHSAQQDPKDTARHQDSCSNRNSEVRGLGFRSQFLKFVHPRIFISISQLC